MPRKNKGKLKKKLPSSKNNFSFSNNDLISGDLPLLLPKESILEDLPPFVNAKLFGKPQPNKKNKNDTHEIQILPNNFLAFDSVPLNYIEEVQDHENKDNLQPSHLSNFTPPPHINDFKPNSFDLNALQLLPESKWINEKINNVENNIILDFSNKILGDQYCYLLIKSIGNNIKHVLLANNRLTDNGIQKLLTCLSENNSLLLESIDLSDNNIRKKGGILLSNYIKNSNTLQKLILRKLSLKDINLEILCNGLFIKTKASHLISLDVSDNELSDSSICYLSSYLHDSLLKYLNLSWNQIQYKGVIALFNSLKQNQSLTTLDLSWNSIGSPSVDKNRLVAASLKNMLIDNVTLIHLNLTNNQLNSFDFPIISEGLNKNKTLLGLHIDSNVGIIDSYGYLNEPSLTNNKYSNNNIKKTCVCWVCNNWIRQSYSYVVTDELINEQNKLIVNEERNNQDNNNNKDKNVNLITSTTYPIKDEYPIPIIYLLTSYDNWRPDMMQIQVNIDEINDLKHKKNNNINFNNSNNILFQLLRSVPPGIHYYLFSLDCKRFFYDPNKEFVPLKDMIKDIGETSDIQFPSYINIASSNNNKSSYIERLLGNNIGLQRSHIVFPRNKIFDVIPHKRISLLINNTINHNIEHQNIWFEDFYQNSEVIKEMVMDPNYSSSIESSLSNNIGLISNIFEFFTSIYSKFESLHMEMDCLYLFLSKCLLMEDDNSGSAFTQQEYLLMFKSFAIKKLFDDEYILVLTRSIFINFIVSLSLKKYISQKMRDPGIALENFLNRNIMANIGETGWIKEKLFRNDYIITKEIELIFHIHLEKVANLFNKYSKINLDKNNKNNDINSLYDDGVDDGDSKEGDTYMTLNQWKNMFDQYPMENQIQKNKILWLCFRASKPLFLDNSDDMEAYTEVNLY
jgi:hypothetical protein